MSEFDHVFQPLNIGPLTVKNRIEAAPAGPMLASSDSLVAPELIEYHRRLAEGGAGIVTVGISLVNPEAMVPNILNLSDDRVVFRLAALVEAVQRYGAKASIELTAIAFGSGPTDTPDNIVSPADTVTRDQIKTVIEHYVKAVERCVVAGMDMVLIHGGHGLYISNFFSPLYNHRTDEYGGSFENRARFAVELLDAIRSRVGRRIAIEYRISADELFEGGAGEEETLAFAELIQDKIDLLHVSAGMLNKDKLVKHLIQPIYFKRGYNVHFAEKFKRALTVPVATVGSLDMGMAEDVLAKGRADVVAMIRSLIADPRCVNKARTGNTNAIRPCIRCNMCINRTHYYPLPMRCAVNPLAGREFEFKNNNPPEALKNAVVVGGGPAGMQAARTLADRGHRVTLFEKENTLGGVLNVAKTAPFKKDVKDYLEWAIRITSASDKISVKLNTEATPEIVLAEKPDALIVATGAKPFFPPIKGIDGPRVVWGGDVESGKASVGQRVVVAGGGQTGCEVALHLAQQGKTVVLVEMLSLDEMICNAPRINMNAVVSLMEEAGVDIRNETKLMEIDSGLVVVVSDDKEENISCDGAVVVGNGKEEIIPCDSVVVCLGVVPDQEMVDRFAGLVSDFHVVGDSTTSRGNLWTATTSAFNAAMNV